MTPFEDLIKELGALMDLPLKVDARQACNLQFPEQNLLIKIDLDRNADKIIIGTELGPLEPGLYRESIFRQAMRVNGITTAPQGILAFSEKQQALVLFQYLPLSDLTGESLFQFIQVFLLHATSWKEALSKNEVPAIEGVA